MAGKGVYIISGLCKGRKDMTVHLCNGSLNYQVFEILFII